VRRVIGALFLALGVPAHLEAAGGFDPEGHAWNEAPPAASETDVRLLGIEDDVVSLIEGKTGGKAQLFRGGDGARAVGLVWSAAAGKTDAILDSVRRPLAARGYSLFVAERNYGTAPDRIAVVKSRDPVAPLVATGAAGPGVTNAELVARVREWSRRDPLEIRGAGADWVEIEFARPPAALDALADEIRRLAPAAVPPTADGLADLKAGIVRTRRVLLWWE
jgi:hypothetical protein